MEITPQSVYADAILTYGVRAQEDMLHEEVGELLSALNKYNRGRCSEEEVITEIADCQIMLGQMAFLFDEKKVQAEFERKLIRLRGRIDKYREEHGGKGNG